MTEKKYMTQLSVWGSVGYIAIIYKQSNKNGKWFLLFFRYFFIQFIGIQGGDEQ